ncbi:IclR family transcriptional regulator [Nocardioides gilvus]|uniref:IclR family transcriptional regulator n=1 Tax=Nocardioides gilvus TaxID=1735589 RepID=UPI000D7440F6|nr:IclR family transcriptional regulator [Nocardioides gilvus]
MMHRPAVGGPAPVATLERALDVLQELGHGHGDRGVSELSQALGMPKGSVHRILTALAARGLVQQDPRTQRYALGWAVLRLSTVYLSRADVTVLARPVLEKLSSVTGETATLSVRVGRWQRIYAAQVLPDREVRMTVTEAEPYPLHAGGSGRALLAFLPEREQRAYLARWESTVVGERASEELSELRGLIEVTRSQGWTRSGGQHMPGSASVAAPVLDHRGEAVAAVSVCGPALRFASSVEQHTAHLLGAAATLSARFGWNV